MVDQPLSQRLRDLLQGDEQALAFNLALIEVLHVWDDLIDLDKPVSPEQIHRAFRTALVVLPSNPFYQQHFSQLFPLIDNLILNWLAANEMESKGEQLDIAWVIRSDYCNVLLKCLQIVGGFTYAREVWPSVRAFWHAEGYTKYLANLANEPSKGGAHVL